MSMSKKDYVKFADMFKGVKEDIEAEESTVIRAHYQNIFNKIVEETCKVFAADNYRFDSGRFWDWINK